jgi:hypothetical protein
MATSRLKEKQSLTKSPDTTLVSPKPPIEPDHTAAITRPLAPSLKVDTVYVARPGVLDMYVGQDAQELIQQIQSGDDSPYLYYTPSGKPFYIAIENKALEPLTFPEPKDYGTTSANLFAMAVTCADAIAEFVRLKIKGKQGFAAQLRQIGVVAVPLVIAIFLIFILAVYIGGGGK